MERFKNQAAETIRQTRRVMRLEQITAQRDSVESEWRAINKQINALQDSAPRGAMGLTAESVKASPEWAELRAKQARAFNELRRLNTLLNQAKKLN